MAVEQMLQPRRAGPRRPADEKKLTLRALLQRALDCGPILHAACPSSSIPPVFTRAYHAACVAATPRLTSADSAVAKTSLTTPRQFGAGVLLRLARTLGINRAGDRHAWTVMSGLPGGTARNRPPCRIARPPRPARRTRFPPRPPDRRKPARAASGSTSITARACSSPRAKTAHGASACATSIPATFCSKMKTRARSSARPSAYYVRFRHRNLGRRLRRRRKPRARP